MQRRARTILLFATAALAAAGGFYGARWTDAGATPSPSTAPSEDTPAVPVTTEDVRSGELAEPASAYGVVQSRPGSAVALSVPFEAVPKAVHVAVGEGVAAGTPVVAIEPSPDALLQLRLAEQALATAERAAEQAARRRDEKLATNADVAAAEQTLQTTRTQREALKNRGVGDEAILAATKAGVVIAVAAQPGQVVPAGGPLVVIAPDDSIEVRIGVDPADLAGVAPGGAVSVQLPGSTSTLAGTVRQQSRVLNPQRLCDVFVRLNAVAALRPGTFVEARFARRTVSGLIVPRAATQLEDDGWSVYVVKDGKAVRHLVTLGPTDGKDIVVSGAGLAEGDAVVVERDGELHDGAAVKSEPPDEDAK